jgi:hypothetical protein
MTTDHKQNESISYCVEELENELEEEINIENLMSEIYDSELNDSELNDSELNDSLIVSKMINYQENFTVKELLIICDYYALSKEIKQHKCNKEEIIEILVSFESETNNSDITFNRQNLWFYMNELKNDKFMKKFLLW